MFGSFKAALQALQGEAEGLFNRVTTKGQLERVVSAACLIAWADGSCDPEEKQKTMGVVKAKLPHFGAADVAAAWQKAEGLLELGFDFGKPDLLNQIGGASGEEADLIVRVAILIGAADGDFDDQEKAVAREICNVLGVSPSTYDL